MRVLIDGVETPEAEARISIFDWGLQRGFGCFEVIRVYDGRPFRLEAHLDRLANSAAALGITVPPRASLQDWVLTVARAGGECQVRVLLTGGGRDPLAPVAGSTVVLWEPVPQLPSRLRLLPVDAVWHPATDRSPFYAVKWLSYAANMASTDRARRAGYHDALLLSRDGLVLEGPTFSVAWIADGCLETPALSLGILPSITRDAVLAEGAGRTGLTVAEGAFPLERLVEAEGAVALSTVKEVLPIEAVGERSLAIGDAGRRLAEAFRAIVAEEVG